MHIAEASFIPQNTLVPLFINSNPTNMSCMFIVVSPRLTQWIRLDSRFSCVVENPKQGTTSVAKYYPAREDKREMGSWTFVAKTISLYSENENKTN